MTLSPSKKTGYASEIIMVKAESNYSFIHFANGRRLFTSKTLKHWQSCFEGKDFIRIHRSYLINKNFIRKIDRSAKEIFLENDLSASIARSFKMRSLQKIQ
ncbi:MAG: LytTR family transcriptional regulator DNA-binding domain-containing protein [Saprospiraceae bacterium]|nr:LytTR family transcriptional regulator DNA-binding domain-containing protein [Saprospiraceae bacterium]